MNEATAKVTAVKAERPEDTTAAILYDEQQRLVDAVLSVARDNGWCAETVEALSAAYPEGSPWSDGQWRNTEGYNCLGYGADGFTREGVDRDGYNREGKDYSGNTREQNNRPYGAPCGCSLCQAARTAPTREDYTARG